MSLRDMLPKGISNIISHTSQHLKEEQKDLADATQELSTTASQLNPADYYGTATTSSTTTLGNFLPNSGTSTSTWTTGGIVAGWPLSDTAEFKKLKCKLPETTLEKLMMIGLPKSKKVLKQRINEEFTKWCNTQEIDVNVFPMLLAACVVMLNDGSEEEPNLKEEK